MAGKQAASHTLSGARAWFRRHEQTLLIVNGVSVALLFLLYFFGTTASVHPPAVAGFVNAFAIVLVSFIFATVLWKGLVPAVICMLGVVLVHNAIILPYYPPAPAVFPEELLTGTPAQERSAEVSAMVATAMHFFLGLGMIAFAMIIAYRPGFLFTRNRPPPVEDQWSRYPVWYDNVKLVGDHREQMVPAKSLMEDRDRYLIWRYEYVLAKIYGTPHLVRPLGLVPKRETVFIRDEETGLLVGKARHSGYFT
jgi:hypothetical protein